MSPMHGTKIVVISSVDGYENLCTYMRQSEDPRVGRLVFALDAKDITDLGSDYCQVWVFDYNSSDLNDILNDAAVPDDVVVQFDSLAGIPQ